MNENASAPGAEGSDKGLADVVLPGFLLWEQDGLWADLPGMGGSQAFADVVDRLFTMGVFFTGLDYEVFQRLVFDLEPGALQDELEALRAAGKPLRLRFAQGLGRMTDERIRLYRPLRIAGGVAYYLFEPLSVEREVPGEDGQLRVETVALRLDPDEFVCQLWVKGIRSGIDLSLVRSLIASNTYGQQAVARTRAPQPGQDAQAGEVHGGLHRDDAPRRLDDGRVDLTVFSNRFPQIARGTRLMRKIPLVLGAQGRDLGGRPLAPPVPRDLDLATLAGPGTALERAADGEYIVATQDGFLNIDADTSQLSVTEKIIHKEGVSLRTTGDLALTGEHYEEHGEILERRTVEGRNITVLADVHGRLLSTGGEIVVSANLSGGQAINQDGPVTVEGRASAAQILAPRGTVHVERAEGSLLLGRRVEVGRATHCEIIADEVHIEVAEACSIVARRIHVGGTGVRNQRGCVLLLREPVAGPYLSRLQQLAGALAALQAQRGPLQSELDALAGDAEFARFLKILGQIKRGETHIPAEREAGWKQVMGRWAPSLQRFTLLRQLLEKNSQEQAANATDVAAVQAAMREAWAAVGCDIDMVDAELSLRRIPDVIADRLPELSAAEARSLLNSHLAAGERLPVPAAGPFQWQAEAPPEAG